MSGHVEKDSGVKSGDMPLNQGCTFLKRLLTRRSTRSPATGLTSSAAPRVSRHSLLTAIQQNSKRPFKKNATQLWPQMNGERTRHSAHLKQPTVTKALFFLGNTMQQSVISFKRGHKVPKASLQRMRTSYYRNNISVKSLCSTLI